MIDKDLQALILRDSRDQLDELETDLWKRESAFQKGRRAARQLASWQALILVAAAISSATTGMALASAASPHPGITDTVSLAPSTLLFGNSR